MKVAKIANPFFAIYSEHHLFFGVSKVGVYVSLKVKVYVTFNLILVIHCF